MWKIQVKYQKTKWEYYDCVLKSPYIIWRLDQLEHVAGAVNLPDVLTLRRRAMSVLEAKRVLEKGLM